MNTSSSSSASSAWSQNRSIVLVGMMGAGKTSVGKRLAARLNLPFVDSDAVIEADEGLSVADIFVQKGEASFRQKEQATVALLLNRPPCVLSLGGGAFVHEVTRALIREKAISVWLKADVGMLLERALRYGKRPLLKEGDPEEKMTKILDSREKIYAEADIVVESDNRPVDTTAARVEKALEAYTRKKTVE